MSTLAQRLAQAVQLHQAGRFAEAEALYRGILGEAPRQADALHLLGALANQTGRPQEAIELIGRALAIRGPHPVFHNNLGSAYLGADRLIEAAAHCREAIRLKPDLPDAHNNLGVALRRQGQLQEAERAFREAIRLNPQFIDALANLGATLHQQGRLPEALAVLQDAVRHAPGHAQARNDLGGVLSDCGQPAQAEPHLREAIRLRGDFATAYCNLGVVLLDLDRVEEATRCVREALRLNPSYLTARNNLGLILESQGRMDEALVQFQETLRAEPNNPLALSHLVKLAAVGKYTLGADELRDIQELAERPDLLREGVIALLFALAQLFDRNGDYEQAFSYCRRANEVKKESCRQRGVGFDPVAHRALIDRIIAATPAAWFSGVGSQEASELPVFIVGMPRSGTTLVEQILACHPRAHGAGELKEIDSLAKDLPRRLREGEAPAEPYPECLARLDAAHAASLAAEHLRRLRQLGGSADRVVDKMPFNFLHLGLVAALFPRARVIHCRRDPVDTCLSCHFQNFVALHPFTLDLRSLGQYYREYERLMAHWARVLPLPVLELRYEALIADQEGVSRRLLEFCGLEWDERCLRFHEDHRYIKTASLLSVRLPMFNTSVGRWKRYEAHLQPLLEALGIPREAGNTFA